MQQMKRKEKAPMVMVGGSSIITIFAVLSLLIFALLALSSASTNAKMIDKAADSVKKYYEADSSAEERLAQIRQEADGEYSYSYSITDTTELSVLVEKEGSNYYILEWQQKYVGDWQPDDTIEVWDGSLE
jgi:Na+-transporting methylmalonyl-CoA/oxaloacetate decarboxylase gamma subunit